MATIEQADTRQTRSLAGIWKNIPPRIRMRLNEIRSERGLSRIVEAATVIYAQPSGSRAKLDKLIASLTAAAGPRRK